MNQSRAPKAMVLDLTATGYRRLLAGPPETVTMHSGLVTLEPGDSVGIHSTGPKEEALVVLQGRGKLIITDGPELDLVAPMMAYCPLRTEHNVINSGKKPLRYIYIVANTE